MKKKSRISQFVEWLPPKLYKGDEAKEKEGMTNENLEETLLSITDTIDNIIAEQKKLRSRADDTGKFGEYRYRDGMVAGLTYARETVGDYLRSLWGM